MAHPDFSVSPFVVLDSVHGKFIVNRYCKFQAEALVKTGRTHIEAELEKLFLIVDRLPDEMVIIDGGANIGFVTIPIAQRILSRHGLVLSFEPQRMLYCALAGSVALNNLQNVRLFQQGLGSEPSLGYLPPIDYEQDADFGMVSLLAASDRGSTHESVEIVCLDQLALPRVDLIKLDVEGHECAALEGGMGLIQSQRPYLWIEYFLIGADAIREVLAEVPDYDYAVLDYQNMLFAPREKLMAMGLRLA